MCRPGDEGNSTAVEVESPTLRLLVTIMVPSGRAAALNAELETIRLDDLSKAIGHSLHDDETDAVARGDSSPGEERSAQKISAPSPQSSLPDDAAQNRDSTQPIDTAAAKTSSAEQTPGFFGDCACSKRLDRLWKHVPQSMRNARVLLLYHYFPFDRTVFGRLNSPIGFGLQVIASFPIAWLRALFFTVVFCCMVCVCSRSLHTIW